MKQPISLPQKSSWPKTVRTLFCSCIWHSLGGISTPSSFPLSLAVGLRIGSPALRGCWGKESVVSSFPSLILVLSIAPSHFSALPACLETVACKEVRSIRAPVPVGCIRLRLVKVDEVTSGWSCVRLHNATPPPPLSICCRSRASVESWLCQRNPSFFPCHLLQALPKIIAFLSSPSLHYHQNRKKIPLNLSHTWSVERN